MLAALSFAGARPGMSTGYAADSTITPPAPPTFIPTPIGSPPPPPTSIASPTPAPAASDTAVPTVTATGGPTATTVAEVYDFSLDAARVARPNTPGNFSGLASVRKGSTVWLMMYYTVRSLPSKATRTTTYEIDRQGKTVYKVAYRATMKKSDLGRFSRYQVFTVGQGLAFGRYSFRASLAIGKVRQSRSWPFLVGRRELAAKNAGSG